MRAQGVSKFCFSTLQLSSISTGVLIQDSFVCVYCIATKGTSDLKLYIYNIYIYLKGKKTLVIRTECKHSRSAGEENLPTPLQLRPGRLNRLSSLRRSGKERKKLLGIVPCYVSATEPWQLHGACALLPPSPKETTATRLLQGDCSSAQAPWLRRL